MKKVYLLVLAFVLVFSAGILADMNKGEMQGSMMWGNADVKVENTADGIKVLITSKDADDVKMIQEKGAEMAKMHADMKAGMGMGKMNMDMKAGMGMGKDAWKMHHIRENIETAFKFLKVIWSLLILLLASTTVLVIKKIIVK